MLSKNTFNVLVDTLASRPAATAFQAAVIGRHALDLKSQVILSEGLGSQLKSRTKLPSAVDEVVASIVSGAPLTLSTKREIIKAMSSAQAGNELINFVQSSPTAPVKI